MTWNLTSKWSIATQESEGVSGTFENNKYTVSNLTVDVGYVEFTCTKSGSATLKKRFTLTKQYAGLDGEAAVVYSLKSSTTSPYEGVFIVKESENGVTYTSKYISTQNEASIEYTLSSNKVVSVQCSLCEAEKVSNELDRITIPVLTDESIKSEITEIKTQISGVSSTVDAVKKSITDKVWQSDITNQIDNFNNTTVKEIRDQVAEQKTEIGKISTEVSDVKTTVETKADGSTVQKLEERMTKSEQTAESFKQVRFVLILQQRVFITGELNTQQIITILTHQICQQ